ncbi:MAG: DUF2203 domain-containing protein [Thermoplasmata archaeon]|nr:DUF2203 domain-containing protein [Thermoplasmata archaeon]
MVAGEAQLMGSPADIRLHSDALSRLFTEPEANAFVPRLEQTFLRLDPTLARLRELRDLIEDSEEYYGEGLTTAPEADRATYANLLQEESDLERSMQSELDGLRAFGCEVKDVQRGLVDFPARLEDELVYLCWQRGEDRIGWWHTLAAGFAGRKALPARAER